MYIMSALYSLPSVILPRQPQERAAAYASAAAGVIVELREEITAYKDMLGAVIGNSVYTKLIDRAKGKMDQIRVMFCEGLNDWNSVDQTIDRNIRESYNLHVTQVETIRDIAAGAFLEQQQNRMAVAEVQACKCTLL